MPENAESAGGVTAPAALRRPRCGANLAHDAGQAQPELFDPLGRGDHHVSPVPQLEPGGAAVLHGELERHRLGGRPQFAFVQPRRGEPFVGHLKQRRLPRWIVLFLFIRGVGVLGGGDSLEVIHGDHLDRDILTEIGIAEHHIAIAALTDDLASIAAALLASDMGVQRTGLLLYDADLVKVTQRMGITFAVDRKRVAVDNMLAQIHTKTAGAYALLTNIPNIVGVSMEVNERAKFSGKRIVEANFPEWMRIAFIQRRNTAGLWESLRPSPEKTLLNGDRLIIFCSPDRISDIEKRFRV